jgi:outer membrane lipopolysaccharide assembly protein LptE/RlpB
MQKSFLAIFCFLVLTSTAQANEQDCKLNILHSSIGTRHSFSMKVTCNGHYNTLTYRLRSKQEKNGATLIDSESGQLHIRRDSQTTGDITIEIKEGEQISVEGRILQACEVLGETSLEYTHKSSR